MNKMPIAATALITLSLLSGCIGSSADNAAPPAQRTPASVPPTSDTHNDASLNIPDGAKALISAYPDYIAGYTDNKIIFCDNTGLIYDDEVDKDFPTMLDNSDVEDMFSMTYEVCDTPRYLANAGRSRCEALFKKMYGSSESQVRSNLTSVDWFGDKVPFTRINGAADSLRAVAAELAGHPELRKYLKSSGSFYWRKVRGANRQSAHSYGIALDISVEYSDYWRWKNPRATETSQVAYANHIPRELVDIFQRHGFIWGGAWYHFDTMHFEFRPEILAFAHLTTH